MGFHRQILFQLIKHQSNQILFQNIVEAKRKKCYYKSTDNKVFRKYTLIVAISMNGLIGYESYEKGGITTDRFLKFINNNILKKFKNKLLLFDNAKAYIVQ